MREYLPSIGCGDDPGCAPTLLHIPQEPERRDLMSLCSDTQVHKESGQLLGRSAQEETRAQLANGGGHLHTLDVVLAIHFLG